MVRAATVFAGLALTGAVAALGPGAANSILQASIAADAVDAQSDELAGSLGIRVDFGKGAIEGGLAEGGV